MTSEMSRRWKNQEAFPQQDIKGETFTSEKKNEGCKDILSFLYAAYCWQHFTFFMMTYSLVLASCRNKTGIKIVIMNNSKVESMEKFIFGVPLIQKLLHCYRSLTRYCMLRICLRISVAFFGVEWWEQKKGKVCIITAQRGFIWKQNW